MQTGITWRKTQEKVDPVGLSIKIIQLYANFTVGGLLIVNVHGRYIGKNLPVLSARAIKIAIADESLVEATLDLVDNDKVERHARQMKIGGYRDFFERKIRQNDEAVFHNGDIYPPDYQLVIATTWEKTAKPVTDFDHLMPSTPAPG